jgi:hypothetical protein
MQPSFVTYWQRVGKSVGRDMKKGELDISRELFGVLAFPPLPEGHGDLLEHAGNRYGEQSTEQAEEFSTGEEREEGHDGMNPDRSAEDARRQDLPQDNSHEQRHKTATASITAHPCGRAARIDSAAITKVPITGTK